jgi:RNA polymerase sigma-70 factor (ECF subfamily)
VEEAVRRARLGDAAAFDSAVGPELEDLRRLATAIVLDRQVADDVVQESLLAAWRGLNQLRDAAAFRTWLRRIVINRARNALRQPRGLRLLEGAATSEHDRDADPSQTWNDVVALEAAMRQLTGDQRVCVALYYLEGWSVSEIAELLHVPHGTVKSRLHAARARLREALS